MKTLNLQRYKEKLLNLRSRLEEDIPRMIEAVQQEEQPIGEHERFVVPSETVDKEIRLENNEEQIRHAVNSALQRIDQGTYGQCQKCGQAVAKARLDAIPYTPYCVDCERQLERQSGSPGQ